MYEEDIDKIFDPTVSECAKDLDSVKDHADVTAMVLSNTHLDMDGYFD